MRYLSAVLSLAFFTTSAMAIDPFTLPWKNHAISGMEYKSADHPNGIFVIHHFWYGCGFSHDHEPNVIELANEYLSESLVQVLDVGLPTGEPDFQKWNEKFLPPYPVLEDKGRLALQTRN